MAEDIKRAGNPGSKEESSRGIRPDETASAQKNVDSKIVELFLNIRQEPEGWGAQPTLAARLVQGGLVRAEQGIQ
jgi:hypothetical protein